MNKYFITKTQRLGCIVAIVFVTALSVIAQRPERVVNSWKPLHYDVTLSFDDQLTELDSARTDISLEVLADRLTNVDLDFGDLPIDSVQVSGVAAKFERSPEMLNVFLAKTAHRSDRLTISISYHGHPKDGLVFAKDRDGNPSATGDNWPNRVHYWIPSLDQPSAKATVSFKVAALPRYNVVANGQFVSVTHNGAAPSFWKFEEARRIPPYCMVVVVNQGALLPTPYEPVPLSYLVPQKDRDYATKGFAPAGPAVSFFSQTIARYPYEKLALIIGATRYGGMENSSAIVFTSTLFDQRTSDKLSARFGIPTRIEDVVAHEIAHQWFGDTVTESTWADLWLSEGFATYFAGLFIEKYEGEDAFREYMRNAAARYFNYEKQHRTPIHDTATQNLNDLLNPNNYEKGAWVLHMLRSQLGDEAFFKGLRDYYNAHREANATTEDLRAALEKSSGKNLKEFFARWVYGSGHPIYQLSWTTKVVSEKNDIVTVMIRQTQPGEVFSDPMPVVFSLKSLGLQDQRVLIKPNGRVTSQEFHFPGAPDAIQTDPNETLLKEVVKN